MYNIQSGYKIHSDLIKSEYLILGRRLDQLCNANMMTDGTNCFTHNL